jgi:hypothetical protein
MVVALRYVETVHKPLNLMDCNFLLTEIHYQITGRTESYTFSIPESEVKALKIFVGVK